MFFIPFLFLAFLNFKGTPLYVMISLSLIGASGMYMIEMMSMRVEGLKSYFSDPWNYADQLIFILHITFCIFLIMENKYLSKEELDAIELIELADIVNYLKLLKVSIVVLAFLKITWYQKLNKRLGLL